MTSISRSEILQYLRETNPTKLDKLYKKAHHIRQKECGKSIFLRGIIEYSNICRKDCYYCGIRKSNQCTGSFELSNSEVLEATISIQRSGINSIVLQSGERNDKAFIDKIDKIIRLIKQQSNNKIGITLSCGVQNKETYRKWFESGAHRYLLRIESSNIDLYKSIHPLNDRHSYTNRLNALKTIKDVGYQTGTGIMVGLPFQTYEHLADDLFFMHDMDIDMVGLGPYILQNNTPLYALKDELYCKGSNLETSLKFIAMLRILMPDINIAASTALDAIKTGSRIRALHSGANVFMPNFTPEKHVNSYELYQGKSTLADQGSCLIRDFAMGLSVYGDHFEYNAWGDSRRFFKRKSKNHIKS